MFVESDIKVNGCTSLVSPDSATQTLIEDYPGLNWTNPDPCPIP